MYQWTIATNTSYKNNINNKQNQTTLLKHKLAIAIAPYLPRLILINGRNIKTIGRMIYLIVSAKHINEQIYIGVPAGINLLKNSLTLSPTRFKNKDINLLNTIVIKNTQNKKGL